ncbi:hypothetical protein AMJ48_00240 [Parcubacteria bacterium DG_74_1]|nr:MAG: hypothetical protein AMJ48_00240 [Parcubacteria bacterium DG_74_1]
MKKFFLGFLLMVLMLPIAASAVYTSPLPTNIELLVMIARIADYLFWILLAISIVFIVYAGILFVTAAGNTEQVERARHIILYAVIGIIVAMLAYGIRTFLLQAGTP